MARIKRQNDNGFNVKEAFETALEKQHKYWTQSAPDAEEKEEEASFWSKLTTCFQSPLKCNPGVQIDFRGKKVKENPLKTQFKNKPTSTSIRFEPDEGQIEFEFKKEVAIVIDNSDEKKQNIVMKKNKIDNSDEKRILDIKTQYLIVQVLDNEIERNSQDRVIAESLITFVGFDKTKRNYCKIPIYDSVKASESGQVILNAELKESDGLDSKLHIIVEKIIDLKDPTADLVKDDSTVKRDVIILISWIIYMILSIIFYIYGEDFIFIDALYLRIVTAFTVGYGDMYPVTNLGKLLNCLFIIIDSVAIGFLTSKVMNYILRFREIQKEKRENAKRKEMQKAKEIQEKAEKENKEKLKRQASLNKLNNNNNNNNNEEKEPEFEERKYAMDDSKNGNAMQHAMTEMGDAVGDAIGDAVNEVGEAIQETAKKGEKAASNFWSQNKLYILGSIILLFIIIGTLFMIYVEEQDAASAFEWNFVTLSTVGYGDVTPKTHGGKVFTIFYIIFGVSLVVMFGTAIFEKLDENRQRKFKESVMRRALISEAQLLEFDKDNDGKIDKYEFLSKMLVETQEVEQSKIDEIMTKFKMLDADGSGEITVAELREIEQGD